MKKTLIPTLALLALALLCAFPATADDAATTLQSTTIDLAASPFLNLGADTGAESCQAASTQGPLVPETFDQSCYRPAPPTSCQCGSCCVNCKCWQGYNLALCLPGGGFRSGS
ncbi:MAG: hypothetical protein SX243_16725 [Acidobacteriota bacterium]|nr:hypothetical protein [Acidobacteriota bacterium]